MMNKFKIFFKTLYRSLVDFNYYSDIYKASFYFSLKYLFMLLFVMQFIQSIFFATELGKLIPKVPNFITTVKTTVNNFFPEDLIITFNNGRVRTNVDEPFFIELPKNLTSGEIQLNKHLITIDTKAQIEDIKKYNTSILITANAFIYPDGNKGYKVQFLNDLKGHFQIDKRNYFLITNKLLPYLSYTTLFISILIALTIFILPFITTFFALLGKFFYLLFFSLILLILTKIMTKNIRYKKVFQLAMHASTLPILISYFANLLNLTVPPFTLSTILFLFMIFVFSKLSVSTNH